MKDFYRKFKTTGLIAIIMAVVLLAGCGSTSGDGTGGDAGQEVAQSSVSCKSDTSHNTKAENKKTESATFDPADIDLYSSKSYAEVNDNIPYFSEEDMTTEAFETYSDLDDLGRCGVAYANICKDIMPKEERGAIGQVRPSGWHTVKYPDYIKDRYLYNRCHLIAYCLAGENANEKNLITGTRYMNVEGMLPFEEKVADYVKRTDNYVLYRVTPIFEGDNLVASGVLMEAKSVEDDGKGIQFCVYCYNIQPGIVINYATGESSVSPDAEPLTSESTSQTEVLTSENVTSTTEESTPVAQDQVWIPTNGGKKYHSKSSCSGMKNPVQVSKQEAEEKGYSPCKKCY